MHEKEIKEKLELLISETINKDITFLNTENISLLNSQIGFTPLDLLNFFFSIEKAFKIKFTREEILNVQFDQIGDIERIIQMKCSI